MALHRHRQVALIIALWASTVDAQPEVPAVVVDEAVPAGGPDFFLVPFDVPASTAEIEVRHQSLGDGDILDFGVEDPDGFRGWGGGNTEPAIVGVGAASRSYLPGPMPAGTWYVVVGKAKVVSAAPRSHIEVFLRQSPTLQDATARAPLQAPTLSTTARFYAGDLHVHSADSGDARPPLQEIVDFARSRGLDFVVITDHNTSSQLERLAPVQAANDDVLLVPGMEFTTYGGHMNAFGVSGPVDHKLGLTTTIDDAVAAFAAQGAMVSINHPSLDLGDVCIGCAWTHAVPSSIDAVEVATGGTDQSGFIFGQGARDFWDTVLDDGSHAAPVGGSDDHRAGVDLEAFGSPIGDPTTLIFANGLSTPDLLVGLRDNRTVVKLQGPGDPMVELSTTPARAEHEGRVDTVFGAAGDTVQLSARIVGGAGNTLRFVADGRPGAAATDIAVDSDDVTVDQAVPVPAQGATRWRVEVQKDGVVRTITGHVWVSAKDDVGAGGCGCDLGAPSGAATSLLALSALVRRRWRRGPSVVDQAYRCPPPSTKW